MPKKVDGRLMIMMKIYIDLNLPVRISEEDQTVHSPYFFNNVGIPAQFWKSI